MPLQLKWTTEQAHRSAGLDGLECHTGDFEIGGLEVGHNESTSAGALLGGQRT
jgi:hypothetical protein